MPCVLYNSSINVAKEIYLTDLITANIRIFANFISTRWFVGHWFKNKILEITISFSDVFSSLDANLRSSILQKGKLNKATVPARLKRLPSSCYAYFRCDACTLSVLTVQ